MGVIVIQSRDYMQTIVLSSEHTLKVWMKKHNLKYVEDSNEWQAIDKDRETEDDLDFDYFISRLDVFNAKEILTYDV